MNKIDFKLSNTACMKFISDDLPIDQVYTCLDLNIYWYESDFKLLIGITSAGNIEIFAEKLSKALVGELQLHASLKEGLGLLWNKKFQLDCDSIDYKKQFVYALSNDGHSRYWVGLSHYLWGTHGDANPYVTTWLYNDKDGNIIFEITELYRWSMQEYDPAEKISFISYEEFIKNYKPLIKKVIPVDVAQQWLDQAKGLYHIFYENEQKECKQP